MNLSSVCRICLSDSTRLHSVKHNLLRSLYEQLTNAQFDAGDARPRALCCFCYQKLLRCHTFSQMALRSEKIFNHLYDRGHEEVTHEYTAEVNRNIKQRLSVTSMKFVTIDCNAPNGDSKETIKDEPLPSVNIKEEVTSESNELLKKRPFPEHSTRSRLVFEEELSDLENDSEELLSNTNTDQDKPDDSSMTIKDEPLNRIDSNEEVTTELANFMQTGLFPEHSTKGTLIEDQEKGVEELQAKPDGSKMTFSCNSCFETFDIQSNLISHIRKSHSQAKANQYFTLKHSETTTAKYIIHSQRKKSSDHECDKTYNSKFILYQLEKVHPGENPFACNLCGNKFHCQSDINRHIRTHIDEKHFPCKVCKKQFNNETNLDLHMSTHTGVKPFACNVCDKQFYQKINLVSHIMRTHTGEKSFTCSVCDKRFSRNSNFWRHMRTHTDKKPFACNICKKQFDKTVELVSHNMRNHGGQVVPLKADNDTTNNIRVTKRMSNF